jgi:hypothetical protein
MPAFERVKESRAKVLSLTSRGLEMDPPLSRGRRIFKAKSNYSVIPAKAGIHTVSKRRLRLLRFLHTLFRGQGENQNRAMLPALNTP